MIIEVTQLERGTQTTKQGKAYTGLALNGYKIQDGERAGVYEKFFYEWKDAERIAQIEAAGVGSTLELRYTDDPQNPRYKNLSEVIVVASAGAPGQPSTSNAAPPAKATGSGYTKKSSGSGDYRKPEEIIRTSAAQISKDLVIAMMANAEKFKAMLPTTKTNPEIIMQMVMDNAALIEAYVKGEVNSTVKSNAKDLKSTPAAPEEPPIPGDDDIPF